MFAKPCGDGKRMFLSKQGSNPQGPTEAELAETEEGAGRDRLEYRDSEGVSVMFPLSV